MITATTSATITDSRPALPKAPALYLCRYWEFVIPEKSIRPSGWQLRTSMFPTPNEGEIDKQAQDLANKGMRDVRIVCIAGDE